MGSRGRGATGGGPERGRSSERGLSTVLNYALMLGLLSLLAVGLFVGVGDRVESQQQRAVQSELTVLGNRIAADVAAADRLATLAGGNGTVAGANRTVVVRTRLPERVAGARYEVEILEGEVSGDDTYRIRLRSADPETSATVTVRTDASLATVEIDGGDLVIRYDGSGTLEVEDA